jgi:hypothetical protein
LGKMLRQFMIHRPNADSVPNHANPVFGLGV